MSAIEYKKFKGLRKESLRDNMSDIEMFLTDLFMRIIISCWYYFNCYFQIFVHFVLLLFLFLFCYIKGLRKESLRDNMSDIEMFLTDLGEVQEMLTTF